MKQVNWYQIFGKSNIPDGRTVEPTDDIQIWLNCANIWDKTYTTLAEVLADTDTLSALINSKNAVDYMVRSTTWAASVALVPTMTDNTHPSGVCFAKSAYGTMQPYVAFDGSDSSAIHTANYSVVEDWWIGYQFATNTAIAKATYLLAQAQSQAITPSIKLQASADGITYEDVSSVSTVTIPSGVTKVSGSIKCTSITDKLYYRLFTNGKGVTVFTLQFYSTAITADATAMTLIGANNYAANTLLADSTWCEAICNSEYFESVLNVKVPVMTSNTTPSGECFYSTQDNTYPAWKAFDGDDNTYWANNNEPSPAYSYVGYSFTSSKKIYLAVIRPRQNRPMEYKHQASVDKATWVDLSSNVQYPSSSGTNRVVLNNGGNSYQHYRAYGRCIDSGLGDWVNTLNYYGREDV